MTTRRHLLGSALAFATPATLRAQGQTAAAGATDAMAYRSATQVVQDLRARRYSSLELTDQLISRIERRDAALNAVVVRDFDRARDGARAADAALAQGRSGALLGVPITVKESFRVAGLPSTWGFPQVKGFRASEDALVVARARQAGAVVLGVTNVPLALGDWQSYNDIYGVTRNPWDTTRSPGGSSGGSAAALAAGFGPLSLGSDIGGSLRVPAHFTGTCALKPTQGLVPSRGHTPPGPPALPREVDLAVVGPMARSAQDLALLFDVIAGPDELAGGAGYRMALRGPRHGDLAGWRVLVLDTHPLVPTSTPVRQALERLAGRLSRSGMQVLRSHAALPDLAEVARTYMRLLMSITAAAWPAAVMDEIRPYFAGLATDDRSLGAERLRGMFLSHRDWLAADTVRARQQAQWRALFGAVDLVLCPPFPTPAFAHDHSPRPELRRLEIDGVPQSYLDAGLVWASLASSAGLPAAVVPVERGEGALPIGVQIVGPHLEDRSVLAFAALLEREFGGFVPPPGYA